MRVKRAARTGKEKRASNKAEGRLINGHKDNLFTIKIWARDKAKELRLGGPVHTYNDVTDGEVRRQSAANRQARRRRWSGRVW